MGRQIGERPVAARNRADNAVRAAGDESRRKGRINRSSVHADEAADDVVAARARHVSVGGRVLHRPDIDADQTAEIAERLSVDWPECRRVEDRAAVHAHETADDAVVAGAGYGSGRAGILDQAVDVGDSDEAADDAVVPYRHVAGAGAGLDRAAAGPREPADDALRAGRDGAGGIGMADQGLVV